MSFSWLSRRKTLKYSLLCGQLHDHPEKLLHHQNLFSIDEMKNCLCTPVHCLLGSVTRHVTPYHKWVGKWNCFLQALSLYVSLERYQFQHHLLGHADSGFITVDHYHPILHTPGLLLWFPGILAFFSLGVSAVIRFLPFHSANLLKSP